MDAETRKAFEWIVCMQWIGSRCPICQREIATPDDIKQCKFGYEPDIVHKTCWNEYERRVKR